MVLASLAGTFVPIALASHVSIPFPVIELGAFSTSMTGDAIVIDCTPYSLVVADQYADPGSLFRNVGSVVFLFESSLAKKIGTTFGVAIAGPPKLTTLGKSTYAGNISMGA